jgi:hypothetical protein
MASLQEGCRAELGISPMAPVDNTKTASPALFAQPVAQVYVTAWQWRRYHLGHQRGAAVQSQKRRPHACVRLLGRPQRSLCQQRGHKWQVAPTCC